MKKKKLLASLVAGAFLFAGAPATISMPTGADNVLAITGTAEAAKGGARISAPKPAAKPAAKPAPKSDAASSKSDSGEHKSVSGGGKEYKPSKDAKELDKNPSAAAGKNTPSNTAAAPAQSSSRLGSFMRGVGMLAGGMFLGSMLASLFGMGGGLFADILGLIMNVVLLAAVFMAIRWAWNKFRGNSSDNRYSRSSHGDYRSEPIDITPRETSRQTFQDIQRPGAGSCENGSDAKSIANKYRNM